MTDPNVQLREVLPGDLPILFAQQCDAAAIQMAAFTGSEPGDLDAFQARWAGFLGNPDIIARTILAGGEVAGSISTYLQDGERELTYWIGRAYWRRGIATAAVRLFLAIDTTRPIFARAAKDNLGSLRVLEKCGFQVVGEGSDFAEARGAITEEAILRLDGASAGPVTASRRRLRGRISFRDQRNLSRSLEIPWAMWHNATQETIDMAATAQEKYARLNCRVSASIKTRVEEAAQTLGLSITDFTETAVAEKAEAVLAQAGRIALSEAEFDRFLAAIANPPAPTAKLRDAAESYKKLRQSDPNW